MGIPAKESPEGPPKGPQAKMLVMGASGRIGTILRHFWASDRVLWQTRHTPQDIGADWVVLDPLAAADDLARAAGGCAVILCLAGVVPGRGGDLGDNTRLAEAAIRAGAAAGARVVLASSAAVYGNQPGILDEATPLAPVNAYGRSKAGMEAQGAALGAQLGVPVTSLRIGNIAGLDAILGGWAPGFRLDRFADGRTPRRSFIGVATLARVLGEVLGRADLPPVLNIAGNGVVDMGRLLDAAGLDWSPRPAPQGAIAEVCLSTRALERFITAPATSDADSLVAEWQSLKDAFE